MLSECVVHDETVHYVVIHVFSTEGHRLLTQSFSCIVLQSIAIRRADVAGLGLPFHFAGSANVAAHARGIKSKKVLVSHR